MEDKGFKIMKLLKNPITFLKRKSDKNDFTFIEVANPILSQEDSERSHESNDMQIIDIKIQHEVVIKANESFSNQLQDREAYCACL